MALTRSNSYCLCLFSAFTRKAGVPVSNQVILFAEQRCLEYTPHDLFVMDICETGDSYYIVECGCLNSAGFYDADISAIVEEVTDYFPAMISR